MFFLCHLLYLSCNFLVNIKRGEYYIIEFPLTVDHSDMNVKVYKIDSKSQIKLNIKNNLYGKFDMEEEDLEEYEELGKDYNKKLTEKGTYSLILVNTGDEDALVNIYSYANKIMGNEDNDVKALKKMFTDIETKLVNLYNVNLRLKALQDKNIMEARRIVKGLKVMFIIPIAYFVIGLAKVKAVKMLFAPKNKAMP